MTSPLFKSLPIGSLRYWSEPINVIATYIYKNAAFQFNRRRKIYEAKQRVYDFVLQKKQFVLNLQKPLIFENITQVKNYDLP